jgi:hypothetical protein
MRMITGCTVVMPVVMVMRMITMTMMVVMHRMLDMF